MPIDIHLYETAQSTFDGWAFRKWDPLDQARVDSYIDNILPKELACAASDQDKPQRLPANDMQGRVLVLIVGFSLDPLLQSICAYKPKEVVLILNAQYGEPSSGGWSGCDFGKHVAQAIAKLPAPLHLLPISTLDPLDKDHPSDVFRKLREVLIPRLKRGECLVLDITGGKKSMVAGAFLFGAFAGVDISYVDFDEYDPKTRAPLGYTCRIGLLPNPYEKFRLREWERVRELYNRYAFRGASKVLKFVIPSMNELFSDNEIRSARILRCMMALYESWDNGDYRKSLRLYNKIKGSFRKNSEPLLPSAIIELGDYWPRGSDSETLLTRHKVLEKGTNGRPPLYLDMQRLVVYARDELAKVERLIIYNEDYRSALLRAVGLTEVLLRSRVMILIYTGYIQVAESDECGKPKDYLNWSACSDQVKLCRAAMLKRVVEQEKVYSYIGALRYHDDGNSDDRKKHTKLSWQDNSKNYEFYIRRFQSAPLMPKEALLKREHDLRNKAIHTYLSIPLPIAQNTWAIAKNSVQDFADNWAKLMCCESIPVLTDLPEWGELCTFCDIEFLPPFKESN